MPWNGSCATSIFETASLAGPPVSAELLGNFSGESKCLAKKRRIK